MQTSLSVLKKLDTLKKIYIKDYDLIAKVALDGPFMAVLPFSVAKNYPMLKQNGGVYLKADISLIVHTEKMKLKSMRLVYSEVLKTCLNLAQQD